MNNIRQIIDKHHFLKTTLIALGVSFLAACGGGSNDGSEPAPIVPSPNTEENTAPSISSSPSLTAIEDMAYSYQVDASDAQSATNELVFSIENAPSSMTMNASGLITWTPIEGELSSGEITVVVAENNSTNALTTRQSFTVAVTPVNDQLTVSEIAERFTIDNNSAFSQQLVVSDVDDENNGTDFSFTINNGPTGMTISSTGLIQWVPELEQSTEYDVTINVADGGEDDTNPVAVSFVIDALVYREISGTIANYFTGELLPDVEVALSNGSDTTQSVLSDEQGAYEVSVVDRFLSSRMTLTARLNTFASYSLVFDDEATLENRFIALVPSNVTSRFDPNQDAVVSFDGMDLLSFNANTLNREDGGDIVGEVIAQVTVIDPSSDISIMPGEMIALEGDNIVPIESFGAIDVILTDESGAAVNLQAGQTSDIRIPLSSNANSAPSIIPLYYFDTMQGVWIESGEAVLNTENGESFYAGTVAQFATWNADQRYTTVFIEGCVVDTNGEPLSNATVRSIGSSYNGSSSARTNVDGIFSIPVRQDSTVLLSSENGNQSRTLTVEAGNENLSLTDCLELSAATASITLTWGQNPRDLDSHFYGPTNAEGSSEFHVYYANRQVIVDDTTVFLDVDNVSSFGPEVITVPNFPFAGRYQYLVYQFSGSENILASPTRVRLRVNNQTRIFAPEEGDVTRYWHVFDFVVDSAGNVAIEEVNQWINGFDDRSANAQNDGQQILRHANSIKQNAIDQKYYIKYKN